MHCYQNEILISNKMKIIISFILLFILDGCTKQNIQYQQQPTPLHPTKDFLVTTNGLIDVRINGIKQDHSSQIVSSIIKMNYLDKITIDISCLVISVPCPKSITVQDIDTKQILIDTSSNNSTGLFSVDFIYK